jgi:xanthomonalisin
VSGDTSSTCDDGEQVLDIVNAIGMAPGIKQILFYEGSSNTEILNQMATDNLAKVLSSSWGWNPADAASDDPIFQEFAAQGQSYVSASGDDGAFNSSTYYFPSVDPYVIQVGGTDLTTAGPGGAWAAETGWSHSGGGYISGTPIPSWQQLAGVVNASNQASTTLRNTPDVAAEANLDNPTVVNGSFVTGYGGTSFAAPRWAGFLALVNQQSAANGKGTVGFINPALYSLGVGHSDAFHDITSGNNPPSAGGSGFNAVPGYDLVTGWGSPAGVGLINQLAGSSAAQTSRSTR